MESLFVSPFIYASVIHALRQSLWYFLSSFSTIIDIP